MRRSSLACAAARAAAEGGAASVLRRDLEPSHPWRVELEALADANGNVSSGVGWHSRKMEVSACSSGAI